MLGGVLESETVPLFFDEFSFELSSLLGVDSAEEVGLELTDEVCSSEYFVEGDWFLVSSACLACTASCRPLRAVLASPSHSSASVVSAASSISTGQPLALWIHNIKIVFTGCIRSLKIQ